MKVLAFIAAIPLCLLLTLIALVAHPVIEENPDHE